MESRPSCAASLVPIKLASALESICSSYLKGPQGDCAMGKRAIGHDREQFLTTAERFQIELLDKKNTSRNDNFNQIKCWM